MNKTIEAGKLGIKLTHIFEYEWLYNKEYIKNFIFSCIGNENKIYARQTVVERLDSNSKNTFIIGLRYNSKIVQSLEIKKKNYNAYVVTQIYVYNHTVIIGGISKLIKYAMKNLNIQELYAECDMCKYNGASFEKVGFKFIEIAKPNYIWLNHKSNSIITQKEIEKIKNKRYANKTFNEDNYMYNRGFLKIYNAGYSIWKYN